ncbi:astakine-like [Daktulosphaira vitifoliae]|uniref:astakine-like n=1 Tax=Daktulosphaira vitifoliae TaxID=58002 RepID=UPI0021A9DA07|nr:astakine-like [Daktulosphaira vitifoliae]
MESTSKMLLVVIATFVAAVSTYPSKPSFLGCVGPDDCGVDECCVIGMNRYSVPTCKPLASVGDTCRQSEEPHNITVSYPDGSSADISAHFVICPCAVGLECSDLTSTCLGLEGAGKLLLREDYTDIDDINRL